MLDKINPTKTESWKKLKNLGSISDLKSLFKNDSNRSKKYSLSNDGLFVDFSKNLIDDEILDLLFNLSKRFFLIIAMFCLIALYECMLTSLKTE